MEDPQDFKKLLKNGQVKQMKVISKNMEAENVSMEMKIAALKDLMRKEKEERVRMGGTRWQSSVGTKPAATKKDEKKNKTKQGTFKVLTDEPLDNYSKKKSVKRINGCEFNCGQCELKAAKLECNECIELYCSSCFKHFHNKGALRKHSWRPISQAGRNSEKISLKERSHRKNKEMESLVSIGSSLGSTAVHDFQKASKKLADPSSNQTSSHASPESTEFHSLLNGEYNEKESADSFKSALQDWRKNNKSVLKDSNRQTTGVCIGTSSTPAQPAINIKFSSKSSISYLDRIAIKRYKEEKHSLIPKEKTCTLESERIIEDEKESHRAISRENSQTGYNFKSKQNDALISHGRSRSSSPESVSMEIDIKLIDNTDGIDCIESITLPTIHNASSDEESERRDGRQTLSSIGKLNIVELNFYDCGSCHKLSPSPTASQQSPKSTEISKWKNITGSGVDDSSRSSRKKTTRTPNKETKDSHRDLKTGSFSKRAIVEISSSSSGNEKYSVDSIDGHIVPEIAVSQGTIRASNIEVPTSNIGERVWKPENRYSGMSIYMAGVHAEAFEEKVEDNNTSVLGVENSHVVPGNLLVSTQMGEQKVWVPDVSVVCDEAIQSESRPLSRRKAPPRLSYVGKEEGNGQELDPSFLLPGNLTIDPNTPRVSITSYDFLSAPPPLDKGENWHKLHRASTSLSFSLSPMPLDVWQDSDDSSYFDFPTRPGSRRVSTNTFQKEHAIAEFNNDLKNKIQEAMGKLEVDVGNFKQIPHQESVDHEVNETARSISLTTGISGINETSDPV